MARKFEAPKKEREPDNIELAQMRFARLSLGDALRNVTEHLPDVAWQMEQESIRLYGRWADTADWDDEEPESSGERPPREFATPELCQYVQQVSVWLRSVVQKQADAIASLLLQFDLKHRESGGQAPRFASLWRQHSEMIAQGKHILCPAEAGTKEAVPDVILWRVPPWSDAVFIQAADLMCRSLSVTQVDWSPNTVADAEAAIVWLSQSSPREATLGIDKAVGEYLFIARAMLATEMYPNLQSPQANEPFFVPGVMGRLHYAYEYAGMGLLAPEVKAQLRGRDAQGAMSGGLYELEYAVKLAWRAWENISYAILGAMLDQPYVEHVWRGLDARGQRVLSDEEQAEVAALEKRLEDRNKPGRRSGRDYVEERPQARFERPGETARDARKEWNRWIREEAPEDPGFKYSVEGEEDVSEQSLGSTFRSKEHEAKLPLIREGASARAPHETKAERAIKKAFPALGKELPKAKAPPGGRRLEPFVFTKHERDNDEE